MVDRGGVYTTVGIAFAAVVAFLSAPFWALDVVLLSFSALTIALYCLRKVELPPWLRVKKPEVRSRVFRYSEIAKNSKQRVSRRYVLDTEKSATLSKSELRSLSRDDLAELEAKLQAAE
jgi:membrane protein implicated in regulation of membrane protease activity